MFPTEPTEVCQQLLSGGQPEAPPAGPGRRAVARRPLPDPVCCVYRLHTPRREQPPAAGPLQMLEIRYPDVWRAANTALNTR